MVTILRQGMNTNRDNLVWYLGCGRPNYNKHKGTQRRLVIRFDLECESEEMMTLEKEIAGIKL